MRVLRFLSLIGLAIWIGGFVFYGGAVVPVLHARLPSIEAGSITREVTDRLNLVGVAALAVCWLQVLANRATGTSWERRARLGLSAATTLILGALFVLHRIMDAQLDAGHMRDFYPLHRLYLISSTAQWLVNMGLFWLLAEVPNRHADTDTPGGAH